LPSNLSVGTTRDAMAPAALDAAPGSLPALGISLVERSI
jgi:hypothetical protein